MADSNKESYDKVFSSLEKHHEWFDNSIPLIASENIPSPAVREAVMSDFGNRYAEDGLVSESMPDVPTSMKLRFNAWNWLKNYSKLNLQMSEAFQE